MRLNITRSGGFLLLCLLASLVGCTVTPTPSAKDMSTLLSENIRSSERLYVGKSSSEVAAAVYQTLMLLDTDDMKVRMSDKGVVAYRYSTFYAVFLVGHGMDYYSIKLESLNNGTKATLSYEGVLSSGLIAITPPLVFKQDIPITSDQDPSDFKIFHDRVEFLLGLRDKWITCDDAAKVSTTKKAPPFFCERLGLVNDDPTKTTTK